MSFSFQSPFILRSIISDEISLFMMLVTFLVLITSYLTASNSSFLSPVVFFTLLSCFIVFATSNTFLIYIGYELSIIPIIIIITKGGLYPDRISASLHLLIFTSIFALPFSLALFTLFRSYSSFTIMIPSYLQIYLSPFLSLLIFLAFSVKLPIYGLHF